MANNHEEEVYLQTDVVRGHLVYTCEITGGNGLKVTCVYRFVANRHRLSKERGSFPSAWCSPSILMFHLALVKAIMVYVRFYDTGVY